MSDLPVWVQARWIPAPEGAECPECTAHHPVGIVIPAVYDGVLYWQCRVCVHRWHRHDEGTDEHARAQPYIERGLFGW